MNCSACGNANPDGARFCNECASPLAAPCGSCGGENPPGAKFCNQCASPLGSVATPAPVDYTPKHLADKILQSKSVLEGERKQVTVMFADVKGSMDLAEQVGAEQWHNILDRFFAILAEGVHRFEGTVNQYTGDGIMALFGAPIAHEDHAQRACYAALHLRDELRSYSEEVKRTHDLALSARVGLNSGEVVVGKIGDDLRMDYTAQGHTVGLAQRIEQLVYVHRLGGAVDPELAEVFEVEVAAYQRRRGVGQVAGIGRRERLHALRETDRVPLRRVVHAQVVADLADHHVARVQTHSRREAHTVLALHVGGVARDLLAQLKRRVAGALGVVLVRDRCAEERHDAVAEVLVDGALEAVHAVTQDLEEALEQAVPLLGIELIRQLHRSLHVGEQDCDLLALAFERALRPQDLVGQVLGRVAARDPLR